MTDREQEQLLATATDRFERRLAEEAGAIRVSMLERDATLRQDIADLRSDISAMRLEITGGDNATRLAMTDGDNAIRLAMTEGDQATRLEIARLRLDMSGQFAETRVHAEARHRELLKGALMFWIAQAAATAGIVSALA